MHAECTKILLKFCKMNLFVHPTASEQLSFTQEEPTPIHSTQPLNTVTLTGYQLFCWQQVLTSISCV